MNRRQWLRAAWGAGALLGGAAQADARLHWNRRTLIGFGTTLTLQAGHADALRLERALDAGVSALREIEQQMSLFNPDSALSRLNRDGRLATPPQALLQVLRTARAVAHSSAGAFDVTVQPLWEVFAQAQRQGRLPTAQQVASARAKVDWRRLVIDDDAIRFDAPGMGVTLNGIAQGYAADRVRQVLSAHGIRHALVDAGELAPLGRNAQAQAWSLGIADPHAASRLLARLQADGRCIATSADDQTHFSADHRHHHIFDPRTGYSPPALSSVTVASDSGALADALTKVFFVAGPAGARQLAQRWQVDALWVDKGGRWEATPGLLLTDV